MHSPFTDAPGTPIQNFSARGHGTGLAEIGPLGDAPHRDPNGGRGTLEIAPAWEDALQDLAGCERIWILFWVHRAASPRTRVLPYRDTVERGMFATRAPARPNPIGLSCVRLLGTNGRFVHVAELDALDGSPLLDIKPYIADYDAFPGSRVGWMEASSVRRETIVADGRFQSG